MHLNYKQYQSQQIITVIVITPEICNREAMHLGMTVSLGYMSLSKTY